MVLKSSSATGQRVSTVGSLSFVKIKVSMTRKTGATRDPFPMLPEPAYRVGTGLSIEIEFDVSCAGEAFLSKSRRPLRSRPCIWTDFGKFLIFGAAAFVHW